ncbi:unnamed protein product [Ectocarpus sp. 12 AP-2014]
MLSATNGSPHGTTRWPLGVMTLNLGIRIPHRHHERVVSQGSSPGLARHISVLRVLFCAEGNGHVPSFAPSERLPRLESLDLHASLRRWRWSF